LSVGAIPAEEREAGVESGARAQSIFTLDFPTYVSSSRTLCGKGGLADIKPWFFRWRKLVDAFDVSVPLIPHRTDDSTAIAAGGWYS
jgi:hypothetical protein